MGVEKLYPFTVSNLSLSSSGPLPWCSPAHLPTSAPFRARPSGRHPAGYPAATAWSSGIPAAGSRCLSTRRHPLVGHPVPPRDCAPLTIGLPGPRPARTPTGFPRFAHTRHDRGGCPLYPETSGVPTTDSHYPVAACRLFQRPGPITPVLIPSPRARNNEASTGIHLRSPPGSGGALLRRRPLRTVRAAYRGTRLKQALKGLGQLAVSAHSRCPAEGGSGNGRV